MESEITDRIIFLFVQRFAIGTILADGPSCSSVTSVNSKLKLSSRDLYWAAGSEQVIREMLFVTNLMSKLPDDANARDPQDALPQSFLTKMSRQLLPSGSPKTDSTIFVQNTAGRYPAVTYLSILIKLLPVISFFVKNF